MSREVSVHSSFADASPSDVHKFLRTPERLLPNASPNPNQKSMSVNSNVSDGEDNCARVKL